VGRPVPVRIGAAGLGRGRGLHDTAPGALAHGPIKREGDRRSPAGVFALGPAFGPVTRRPYAPGRWPWRRTTKRDRLVDDPRSPHYNTWEQLPRDGSHPAWRSAEDLSGYRLGLVVRHNRDPVQPGAGSAIFLHLPDPGFGPTVGCTALKRRALLRLLRWLDPKAKPVLAQLPGTLL
jgi:L,D-peptidoglycan transpeptidase YkuD (ErfK/YbiS/YcfS/YnhG family)